MSGPAGASRLTIGVGLYTGQRFSESVGARYADAVALAGAAEAAGFDAFWVSEHHGFPDGYLPAPLVLLGACAAATSSIRLGAGVVLAPLAQPVRLAEEAAVVDHLSHGRLVLGLGIGYLDEELALFGVPRTARARRLEETVAILRRCWRGERFSFHGEHFHLDDALVTPPAFQEGGIPIWLGGYARGALERAARLADGHLVGRGAPAIVAENAAILASALSPARPFTFALNVTAVLTDRGGHPELALEAFERQQATYEEAQRGTDVYAGRVAGGAPGRLALGGIERYVDLLGSADEIAAGAASYLEGLAAFEHVHLVLRIVFPEDDLDAQLERIGRFGRDVLPRLRAAAGAAEHRRPVARAGA
ncbi:MAG TPA: LLM class flavin-dependent oxidoreductase [Acidimicrobiales bacterium]|nr:LLM class flavin-dependent oxidoreductase [Acidimicrobiales bacterium]